MGTRSTEYGTALFGACMRVPAHACICVEGNKHIGMIHQLSTCNQRFGGLMTVRY